MNRDHALDSVRGLAALSVALMHCVLIVGGAEVMSARLSDFPNMSAGSALTRLLYVVFPGDAAVTLFFVLSGHVLWRSFRRSLSSGGVIARLSGFPDYAAARAYRLLPTVAAAALPVAWLLNTPGEIVVPNMFLLRHDLNEVTWTLQIELVCSLALFVVHRLVAGQSWVTACVLLASAYWAYWAEMSLYYGNLLFFPAFLLDALIDAMPRCLWRYPTLLAGLVVASVSGLVYGHDATARAYEMVGATLVVGGVSALQPAVLLKGPLLFLGRISYPLYLSHFSGVIVAWPWVHQATEPHVFRGIALLAVSSLAVAVPLATVIHYLVEKPIVRVRPRLLPVKIAVVADQPERA